ncbi:family 43 glycosylhydrolase [Pedobacter metabolipauper]|uniref:Beta-xylosidase n=1 Tax=Pedobacter metabolipauper TaxID=425513 RepID=A0A4R6STC4_9SPHI|nr:family 43 glycosylhydrolase [Pedobacter metabolipauper]TDQ08597.1 beta-xylosidase [Pedobacter metabolipauper]
MKFALKTLLLFTTLFIAADIPLFAQEIKAVIAGDFADPSVIRKGNEYFAIGTSSEWAPHFPIYKSGNLKDWKQSGYVFDVTPEWAGSSFWAPEYYFHNNTYFVYYSAKRKKDGVSCIGVATSKYPDRDFKDHGVIIEYGKEAIDAFLFNDNGQLYITWKAYGLDGRPIEILGSTVSSDGLSLTGTPFTMMKDDQGIGLEGQSILKKDDFYYLFYSVGNCCGSKCDYNVRVARSKDFKGPYENHLKNPILQENADWKCSGHGTFVNSPDGKYYYLYHAYNKESTVFTGRQGMLAELVWAGKNEWPSFTALSAGLISAGKNNIKDDFNSKSIANYWQWDFRNATPVVKQQKGSLHLSGSITKSNNTGVVLTLRPTAMDYEMTTTVMNQNNALKGLVIYGDANAALGIGVVNNQVEFWSSKDRKRTVLKSILLKNPAAPVDLKITVLPDHTCKVYWKQQKDAWEELVYADQGYSMNHLPQWDRSPRVGLCFHGTPELEAVFSSFNLSYSEK